LLIAAVLLVLTGDAPAAQQNNEPKDVQRPRIVLRARPQVGLSPARVALTAELVGGPADYEEYYCPSIEWDWGDDTTSESTVDCEPYEAGKTEIQRRYKVEHVFRQVGAHRVYFRLKRRGRELAAASVLIQVRPGPGPTEEY
jgi:hypothetical protein